MFTRPSQDRIGPRIHGERTRAYKQSSIRCTNCFTADKYTSGRSLAIDTAVELISKTLIDGKFVSVIDCTEPGAASLARAWPGIRYTVFQTLETFGSTKVHDHVQEGSDTCSNTKPDTCSYEELVGYKQGAATGPTVGMLSLGKTYCRTPGQPGRYSTEYIFCGAPAYVAQTPGQPSTARGLGNCLQCLALINEPVAR